MSSIHLQVYMPRCTSSINDQPDNTAAMSEMICSGCLTLLYYTRGAANIRCSRCRVVNSTRSGQHLQIALTTASSIDARN